MSRKPDQLVRDSEGLLALKMAAVETSLGVATKVQAVIDLREACGIWLAAIEQWTAAARKADRS